MVASTQKALSPQHGKRGQEIPVYTRAKARNLYFQQCLPYKLIAQATGLTVPCLQQLAHREGWTALRREKKQRMMVESAARGEVMIEEVNKAIADRSEQYALRTLDRVEGALERDDEFAARDAQSYTGALRNLVNVARDIRRPAGEQQQTGNTLNMFVLRVGAEATPAQPKLEQQVTEVAATPAP